MAEPVKVPVNVAVTAKVITVFGPAWAGGPAKLKQGLNPPFAGSGWPASAFGNVNDAPTIARAQKHLRRCAMIEPCATGKGAHNRLTRFRTVGFAIFFDFISCSGWIVWINCNPVQRGTRNRPDKASEKFASLQTDSGLQLDLEIA
jgi:hypothetical protein